MRRGIQRTTILAGLTMFVTLVAGVREARAIAALQGISITGSQGPTYGGDPYYTYTFDLNLNGYQWNQSDYLIISGFTGLTADSISPSYSAVINSSTVSLAPSQPSGFGEPTFVGNGMSAVEWQAGSNIAPSTSPYEFSIVTGQEPSNFSLASSLSYQVQATNSTTGTTGQFAASNEPFPGGPYQLQPLAVTVPEPSTVVFLVSAAAVAPIAILVRRQWRHCGAAV